MAKTNKKCSLRRISQIVLENHVSDVHACFLMVLNFVKVCACVHECILSESSNLGLLTVDESGGMVYGCLL